MGNYIVRELMDVLIVELLLAINITYLYLLVYPLLYAAVLASTNQH